MPKKRITITLDQDLLRRVDGLIDGAKVRNRSHAIELLIGSSLVPKTTKVMILAGGEGVKSPPLPYEFPKSLLPVRGKPLLEHTILALRDQGLSEIYISIGYLGNKIVEHFGNGERLGVRIHYLEQSRKRPGTAQPLLEAQNHFAEDPFLVIYGDVLTKLNLIDLIDFHQNSRALATMALVSVEKPAMWGVASIQGSRIVDFVEKPRQARTRSHLINSGIYVLDPAVFRYIDAGADRLEKDFFPRLAAEGKLCAYPFEADWYDVSTPAVYEQVLKNWKG